MALGDGITWDETTPTDANVAVHIDDYNRDLRKGVRGRMALEHEWPDSQAATGEGGKHKFLTLQLQATKPTLAGTQIGAVYQKSDATTGDALFFENSAAQEIILSKKMYFWYLDGAATTGDDVSATLFMVGDGNFLSARAYCSTVCSGNNGIQIDIDYDGSSIWTATANQIILAPGSTSTSVSTFASTVGTKGGILRLNMDKVGDTIAGGGVTVMLEVG